MAVQRWKEWLWAAALIAVTFLVYFPALRAGFIWDDNVFLYDNPLIHASDGLWRFWFTTQAPDYFPLVSSSLWLEWRVFGMHAAGYHVINVLLHAVSAVLLWRVLLKLDVPGAWLAAMIFAVHPVNVESVAWITERKNTLPMVFFLLAMLCFLRFEDSRRRRDYLLALGAFLLALLGKTSVVMLPIVLLLCLWWKNRRIERRDWVRLVPFFGLSLVLGLVTIWFQYHKAISQAAVRTDGFGSRLAIAGRAVWFYLFKAIWPARLSFVYPRWQVDARVVRSYLPLIALLLAFVLLLILRRRRWAAAVGVALGCYVVNLLPVLGFLNIYFMRYSLVADHWQYVALPAVIALVVGSLTWLARRGSPYREIGSFVGVAVVITLSILTIRQAAIYHDLRTLWVDTLTKNPQSALANNNYATLLLDDGDLNNAERHIRTAIATDPRFYEAVTNLGAVFERRGDRAAAIEQYRKAVAMEPRYSVAQTNLGQLLVETGHAAEGLEHLNAAIASNPRYLAAFVARANAFEALNNLDAALADLKSAVAIDPRDADARVELSRIYVRRNEPAAAIREGRVALELDAHNAAAHNNWGMLLEATGNPSGAAEQYRIALELRPNFPQAQRNLRRVTGNSSG